MSREDDIRAGLSSRMGLLGARLDELAVEFGLHVEDVAEHIARRGNSGATMPEHEIGAGAGAWTLTAHMPGARAADVSLRLSGRRLTVTTTAPAYRIEAVLPESADMNAMSLSFEDERLRLVAPTSGPRQETP